LKEGNRENYKLTVMTNFSKGKKNKTANLGHAVLRASSNFVLSRCQKVLLAEPAWKLRDKVWDVFE
jgi:hypothetical protein